MRRKWHLVHQRRQPLSDGTACRDLNQASASHEWTVNEMALVFLAYVLRRQVFALRSLHITDVVDIDMLVSAPTLAGFVSGIVVLSGKSVPVVDLAADLAGVAARRDEHTHIVILETVNTIYPQFVGVLHDGTETGIDPRPIGRNNPNEAPPQTDE